MNGEDDVFGSIMVNLLILATDLEIE